MSRAGTHGSGRRILVSAVTMGGFLLVWFGLAGRLDWVQGWALVVAFAVYVGVVMRRMARHDPDLFEERQRTADNVELWDKAVMRCYSVLLVALLALAALDSGRFGWSVVPMGVQLLGWGLLVAGGAVIWHVTTVNRFLSGWARMQDDRGQVVVSDGLYGMVRHPMYLGIIVCMSGIPLALASWWSLVPAAAVAGTIVYRTAREDQMLRQGLVGYVEYSDRVRYRLAPGVW